MVWFDRDILRLNYDGRGEELGEFQSNDLILVVLQSGDFYTTNFDLSNHYESDILVIEKFNPNKIWTAAYFDGEQNYYYLKRFIFEAGSKKQNFLNENPNSRLVLLTDEMYARIEAVFGGHVIQLRSWLPDAVGGVAWMSFDNPAQSPRFPIFSGTTTLPASFAICGQKSHREDAAIWAFRRANKLATVRWGLTKEEMNNSIRHFEDKGQNELPYVETRYKALQSSKGETAAREFLTGYTADFVGAEMHRWQEMADEFWKMFARGF